MRIVVVLCFLLAAICPLHAAESCMTIRGRAHLFPADGNLRIWHVGTHHDFTPADKCSWDRVDGWLKEGVKPADKDRVAPEAQVFLFADFLICPTEPHRKGWVQKAIVVSATNRRFVPAEIIFEQEQSRSGNNAK